VENDFFIDIAVLFQISFVAVWLSCVHLYVVNKVDHIYYTTIKVDHNAFMLIGLVVFNHLVLMTIVFCTN